MKPVESVPCDCGQQVRLDHVCCGRRYIMAGGRVVRIAVEPQRWTWREWLALACGTVILAAVGWLWSVLGYAL
jgi:hypothetical protein